MRPETTGRIFVFFQPPKTVPKGFLKSVPAINEKTHHVRHGHP